VTWIAQNLWLIPALPLGAAAVVAVTKQAYRRMAASLAIGSMGLAFVLSCAAFFQVLHSDGESSRVVCNAAWFQFGTETLKLGWVLDPLTAVMLVMVTFVGLLIFIYSTGYMAHDPNFTRFFCFLSLFAAAMLGVVIANSLLLLFISWELVGLTSYLLIGFWYHKPEAAAAAKKAFITTRIGDIGLFLGMLWLYHATGTLLFYDEGRGCLEPMTIGRAFLLPGSATAMGALALSGIALLIFVGAMGKSGQVPLHVWLPDAMEGPTPVSALIHAATMVAAGVFLVARVFPLMKPDWETLAGLGQFVNSHPPDVSMIITWVGAITAIFAASIAVVQNDIKRILAYSTVSQLGYMMMGLGAGGVAVGLFHLITHAFFKALLFMGAGSVIHGCHEERDIRHMGGLRRFMPVTFATYAVGMLALAGFPLFFSGFWSKDEILHAAHAWPVSQGPFYLGLTGALLTAFYMTRQVALVFFGSYRGNGHQEKSHSAAKTDRHEEPHESPASMIWPLLILAVCTVLLGVIGTPAWPWFQRFLGVHPEGTTPAGLAAFSPEMLALMGGSTLVVFAGIGLGLWLYGGRRGKSAADVDPLERLQPDVFALLQRKYFVDEFYEETVIRFNAWCSNSCDRMDRWIWGGGVAMLSWGCIGLSWMSRWFDECVINLGFDLGCSGIRGGGGWLSLLQNGQVQRYLALLALALSMLVLGLLWIGR
jgi:NADH-quinone oxidoreductase subunit L